VNVGSDETVSIDGLVDIVEEIAEVRLKREYELDAPQGVRGRSSDNTEILRRYGWAPSWSLADGLERTYAWTYSQVKQRAV
jgi:nucleoside-diphosphate-sugar epimerase